FLVISIVLITFNFILLYILSITIYKHLDVFKYSICLALAQFFYLSARMPVLILKLRYSLSIILWLYVCSLFLSSCYLFLKHNDYDFQYIVQSITLSNFFIFLFSLLIVFYKERIYGKNY
ncbi:TPA: O149 family O-antigen flippase, partial [Escherichia coli]|nr:O149 family O-antigen flippase [Escherichia coli]